MTLIHVTSSAKGKGITFEKLLLNGSHELSVTGDHSSNWTREAERKLRHGPNVYFYAGRALPYGNVTLMFGPKCMTRHTGSATVFDTGELANGGLKHKLFGAGKTANRGPERGLTDEEEGKLRRFVWGNMIPLPGWVDGFRNHLDLNFSEPSHYCDGKPCVPGPEELFSLNHDKPLAWFYEVKCQEGRDIFDALAWNGPAHIKANLVIESLNFEPLKEEEKDFLARLNTFIERAMIPKGTAHGQDMVEPTEEMMRIVGETQLRARRRMGL